MTTPPIKSQILSLLILTLLPLLIYFNSLQGSFQFDDRNLIDREWIADTTAFEKNVRLSEYENRPVLLWTFALNNTLHKNRVFGFHLFNLTLHVFVCILIFVVLTLTQNFLAPPASGRKPPSLLTACLPALLFAVHPLNTDSVSYISSRSTLLATFFYLLTLFAFLKMFSPHKSHWPVRVFFGWLTVTGLYLALASKLIAVTLPLALLLWFWIFIRPQRFPELCTLLFTRKLLPVYGIVLLAFLAAVFSRGMGFLYAPKDQGLELFGRMPYLLIETKVIVFYYLKLFFLPVNLNVDVGFPFSAFADDPGIALAILVIGALLVLAWKTTDPWIKGGVLWFFITLMPTSSIVPLSDLAVEHRMYLPMSLGLCLIVYGVARTISALRQMHFLIVLIALFSVLTVSRNLAWTDEIRLWTDAVAKNPQSPRTHNNLGKAHYEKGRLQEAMAHFLQANKNIEQRLARQYNLANPEEVLDRRAGKNNSTEGMQAHAALKIVADLAEPHYNLASVYLDLGKLELSRQEYQTALRLNPNYFDALFGLGSVLAKTGQRDRALEHFRLSIEKRKSVTGKADYPLARLNIGELLGRAGKYEDAVVELKLALKGDPSMVLGHYNLGLAYLMTGKLELAEKALTACLDRNPRFEAALFNLARVAQAKGDWESSIRRFERFLSVKGEDAGAFFQIGWSHQQAGEMDKARDFYEKALQTNPAIELNKEVLLRLRELP